MMRKRKPLLALKGSMLKLLKYVKNVMKGKEKLNCLKKDKDTEEKVFNRPQIRYFDMQSTITLTKPV